VFLTLPETAKNPQNEIPMFTLKDQSDRKDETLLIDPKPVYQTEINQFGTNFLSSNSLILPMQEVTEAT